MSMEKQKGFWGCQFSSPHSVICLVMFTRGNGSSLHTDHCQPYRVLWDVSSRHTKKSMRFAGYHLETCMWEWMTGDLIIRSLMGPPAQEKIFGSSLYIFHLFDLNKKKTCQATNFSILFNPRSWKHSGNKTGSLNPFKGLRAGNGSWCNISSSTVSRLSCEARAVREAVALWVCAVFTSNRHHGRHQGAGLKHCLHIPRQLKLKFLQLLFIQ